MLKKGKKVVEEIIPNKEKYQGALHKKGMKRMVKSTNKKTGVLIDQDQDQETNSNNIFKAKIKEAISLMSSRLRSNRRHPKDQNKK